jgi:isocitrate/isopropylmalate dehydrogenase
MREDLGHLEAANEIERVVAGAIRARRTTHDLGGDLKTHEVGDVVARELAAAPVAL